MAVLSIAFTVSDHYTMPGLASGFMHLNMAVPGAGNWNHSAIL
jgi:hypothetical protein